MQKNLDETIANIAHRWDGTDRSLLGQVIPRLVRGEPFPARELAAASRYGLTDIEIQLEISGADRNRDGDITGLGGISIDEGAFIVKGPGIDARTCCALTAHAVPIISGKTVEITTQDPVDETPLCISAAPHGVVSSSPESAVANIVLLDAPQPRDGLFMRFCQFARYFGSLRTLSRFPVGDRKTVTLSPEQVHAAARLWAEFVWGIANEVGS